MQLTRAMEILNHDENNTVIYYNDRPVNLVSVEDEIGTAFIQSTYRNLRMQVDVNHLCEKR